MEEPLQAQPFSVQAGQNQPIWVDVFVPREAEAGLYAGKFTASSDQGSARGQIVLRVWSFTLPPQATLKSAFVAMQASRTAVARTLLRNRVSPLNVPPQDLPDLIDRFGLSSANLGFWSGADHSNCSMSAAPSGEQVRAAASQYPPSLTLFNFTADEVARCTGHYPVIQVWGRALHSAAVKNLITMEPTPALFDDGSGTGHTAVDIWAMQPSAYVEASNAIGEALAKGDEVWSYKRLCA